ncbi:hypothetical protein D3C78_1398550 [compost metagenome]
MAHIGTIRKIIGAQFARKKLKEIRGFIGCAARGVKLDGVGWKVTQYFADAGEGVFPFNRAKCVALLMILKRVRETAIAFQFKVTFCQQ